jgi:hypothetical protein
MQFVVGEYTTGSADWPLMNAELRSQFLSLAVLEDRSFPPGLAIFRYGK